MKTVTLGKFEDGRAGRRHDTMHRFIELVDLLENGCWQWLGATTRDGYGQFSVYRENWRAHRFSYLIFNGDFTPDRVLDHLCRNRACVNPEHLEEVTYKENIIRGINTTVLKNKSLNKTHCKRGHEMTTENTYSMGGVGRCCRTCKKLSSLNWYHRSKGLVI